MIQTAQNSSFEIFHYTTEKELSFHIRIRAMGCGPRTANSHVPQSTKNLKKMQMENGDIQFGVFWQWAKRLGSGQKGRNQKTGKKKNRVEQEEEEREVRRSQQREGGTKKVGRLEKQ